MPHRTMNPRTTRRILEKYAEDLAARVEEGTAKRIAGWLRTNAEVLDVLGPDTATFLAEGVEQGAWK